MVLPGIEDGDFSRKVFGLQDDGGREVGQWPGVGYLPLRFHGLGAFAKQGLVALAADESKVLVITCLLIDHH